MSKFKGIVADSRETRNKDGSQEIVKFLQELQVPVESKQLQVGDYILYDKEELPVLVSRKAADFTDSLYSGHLTDELDRCINFIQSYGGGHLFFLLEGPWATSNAKHKGGLAHFKRSGQAWFRQHYTSGGSYKVVPGSQISMQLAGVFLIVTNSVYETALALQSLWERAQANWPTKLTQGIQRPQLRWHNSEQADGQKILRLMALWPHLREDVAYRLLEKYGSIAAIIDAARVEGKPKDLLSVEGVGTTGVTNFRSVVL